MCRSFLLLFFISLTFLFTRSAVAASAGPGGDRFLFTRPVLSTSPEPKQPFLMDQEKPNHESAIRSCKAFQTQALRFSSPNFHPHLSPEDVVDLKAPFSQAIDTLQLILPNKQPSMGNKLLHQTTDLLLSKNPGDWLALKTHLLNNLVPHFLGHLEKIESAETISKIESFLVQITGALERIGAQAPKAQIP